MCIHTHKCTYRYTGKSGSKSDMIDQYSAVRRVCHIQYKCWCKQTNDPKKPKGHHLGNARANTARIVVLSAVRFV